MSHTINLDVPNDAATRVRREDEWNRKHRERIVEVLRKYNVKLEDVPLDALAMAMARISTPPHSEQERVTDLILKVREIFDWHSGCGRYCRDNDAKCSCLVAAKEVVDLMTPSTPP